MGIVEDELGRSTVFRDRAKLDFNYVPPELPHREEQLRALTTLFRVVADQAASQSCFVTGPVGTGKTALSKKFSADFQAACTARGQKVDHVSINCRRNASEGLVMHQILRHFDAHYPERGYSTNEMLRDLRKMVDRRGCHLIVVLDEADALVAKEGGDLVYALTRFDDERPQAKSTVSVILISARPDLPLMLDEAARSTLRRSNVVQLPKYTEPQLLDIARQRAKLAFHKGAVDDEVLQLIAEIAGEDGDARYAIELLDRAGREADEAGSESVDAEHVRAVKAFTRSFATESKLRLLAPHHLLILKAMSRRLARSRAKTFLTTGESEEAYHLVAEEHGEKPRAHTQYWKYLKELETAGWIRVKEPTRDATAGNTQFISLPDVPAKVLLDKLEAVIAETLKPAKR